LLAAELAGHLADLAPVAARYAELVAGIIARVSPKPVEVTTRLTGAKLRRGHSGDAVPSSRGSVGTSIDLTRTTAGRTCTVCGVAIPAEQRGDMCRACFETQRHDLAGANLRASAKKLAELRQQGIDPRSTATARAKRNEGVSRARQAALAWEPTPEEAALTDEWFASVLLPALASVTTRQIQNALGVSNGSATRFRNGKLTPHRRHWLALAALCDLISRPA
jgi:hypothetical protein